MTERGSRVALVTGGSQGIGAAIARRLGNEGVYVYITYLRHEREAEEVISDIRSVGGEGECLRLNVSDEDMVTEVFGRVQKSHGRLDVLVSNAAGGTSKPVDEVDLLGWHEVVDTKVVGALLCTRAALPLFAKSAQASMIAISSNESQRPDPSAVAYGVASAGLDAFVKAMALYLPRYGARCNAVCPGAVRTALWGESEYDSGMWDELAANNPVGRVATPEDVAEIVWLIASEPTRMVNGSFIYVNGGNHLRDA